MRLAGILLVVGATASWADTKTTQLVDRMMVQVEADAVAMKAATGKCDKLAAAITKNLDADNKTFAEMVKTVEKQGDAEIQAYAKDKYLAKFKALAAQAVAATLGCRTNAKVVEAWKANHLVAESFGTLPDEPEPEPVKPPNYDANTKKLDAAIKDYKAVVAKIAATKDCTAAAKLVPAFRAARDREFAEHDKLDKATEEYALKDKTKSDFDAAMQWVESHGRCGKNKAFAAAVTKAGLDVKE